MIEIMYWILSESKETRNQKSLIKSKGCIDSKMDLKKLKKTMEGKRRNG